MINEEGGIDVEEFRFAAVVDRVATTGAVWLGLTVGCAQCHTHKYDPITHREYYSLFAFLNNADEPEIDLPDPAVARPSGRASRPRPERLEADLPDHYPARRPREPGREADGLGEDDQARPTGSILKPTQAGLAEARHADRSARRLGAGHAATSRTTTSTRSRSRPT